ncbi:ABC transporter ATP-binding protein [Desulfovibrio sp.]|uniref:ABC transporter ATP-binding protein n=1 Tax=Desulfovibrio sp. TaxID=885 RepID=UPI0025C454B9|nr:ABC transporter ATP-binding protein [Desulfovibrio sp.]
MPELLVNNVSVQFGAKRVLRGLSMGPVRGGSITALLGSNAAGKSTLLRRISGELTGPGLVRVEGRNVTDWPQQHPNRPAYVPQNIFSDTSLRVVEAVLLAGKLAGAWHVTTSELDTVSEVLRLLHIERLANTPLNELSGGQRQLVFIAQALIRKPRILLLDEPTSALDIQRQFELLSLLRRYAREKGLCIVAALHDINMALRFADRLAVLHQGEIIAFGEPREVITEELLLQVYSVVAHIEEMSSGAVQVVVDGVLPVTE